MSDTKQVVAPFVQGQRVVAVRKSRGMFHSETIISEGDVLCVERTERDARGIWVVFFTGKHHPFRAEDFKISGTVRSIFDVDMIVMVAGSIPVFSEEKVDLCYPAEMFTIIGVRQGRTADETMLSFEGHPGKYPATRFKPAKE